MDPLIVLTPTDGTDDGLDALLASQVAYWELSGESPDEVFPLDDGCEGLVGHDADGRLVVFAELLKSHPRSGHPWIGLLVIDAGVQGKGYGRAAVAAIEARFRLAGRTAVELAVLENNPAAFAFWKSVGYTEFKRALDVQYHRPCIVMRKAL